VRSSLKELSASVKWGRLNRGCSRREGETEDRPSTATSDGNKNDLDTLIRLESLDGFFSPFPRMLTVDPSIRDCFLLE
jgi:hypothetical protein